MKNLIKYIILRAHGWEPCWREVIKGQRQKFMEISMGSVAMRDRETGRILYNLMTAWSIELRTQADKSREHDRI